MKSVNRLRRMSRDELAWRTRTVARIQRDRLASSLRTPTWDRRALLHAVSDDVLAGSFRVQAARGEWAVVHDLLAERIKARGTRFALDPARAPELRDAILHRWPDAARTAAERADRIVAGRFDVLGYRDLPVADGPGVDWHFDPVHRRRAPRAFWADIDYLDPAIGDHKVIWEINRQQHWLALGRALWLTGDDRYGTAIISQLAGWLGANRPLIGVNWASMLELGFRSLSWVWALHFLLGAKSAKSEATTGRPMSGGARAASADDQQPPDAPWLVDMLVSLDRQLTHVEQNLSYYFSPNTHLTGEALALYVTGLSLPELRRSSQWAALGRDILLREIGHQIGRDGGHAERSLHYHRYTLDFYLLALLVAERNGDPAGATFRDAVTRLARFARGMADQRGRFATIGDDDGGMLWPLAGRDVCDVRDSLALAAIALNAPGLAPWGHQEEAYWLAGPNIPEETRISGDAATGRSESIPTVRTQLFPDTGYGVVEDDAGGHLIVDVGAHGFLNGGHAHADALAVTLSVGGRELLIDPGTGTYTMDPALRDRLRRTASHNAVTIDDRSSSEPDGPFHWRTATDSHLTSWRHNSGMAWLEAGHHGYGEVMHRRHVVHVADAGWLIVDEVLGACTRADVHWHFEAGWGLACQDAHLLVATHPSGDQAWMLHDGGNLELFRGDEAAGLGWSAPCYGRVVPAWTARFSHAGAPLPMLTWVGTGAISRPTLERVPVDHDESAPGIAVRIRNGSRTDVVILRPGDAAARGSRSSEAADIGTDARLLHCAFSEGRIASVSLADGTYAWPTGDRPLGVLADQPVTDLHIRVHGERLDLFATTPPPRLRLQGVVAAQARMLTLNGRTIQPARPEPADVLVITSDDWNVCGEEVCTCVA